ncbi:hypothetical protein AN993_01150 [Stenotrophomonas maltophilia]|nr:hypothetical protein AN993_01150 [Stenotrophomonas maltophilia]
MDGAIEPPWKGLRRVLPIHTAPPSHGLCACAFDVDVDVALASAGAGRSPAEHPSPLRMPALVVIARAFIELIQPELFSPRDYDQSGHSER